MVTLLRAAILAEIRTRCMLDEETAARSGGSLVRTASVRAKGLQVDIR
jgi:hypothetical protein